MIVDELVNEFHKIIRQMKIEKVSEIQHYVELELADGTDRYRIHIKKLKR